MKTKKDKLVAIVGPTASGKSGLAVRIARKFKGEIVSADSRQVYTGLNIGSGKITPREMKGIPHYMLDVASPKRTMSVSRYQKLGLEAIGKILGHGAIPVICGGTGLYVQALADGTVFPEVKPDAKLRKKLSKKSTEELARMLEELDRRRWKEIDRRNPRRLIRAIEIAKTLGKVPKQTATKTFEILQIGIAVEDKKLRQKINRRLKERINHGMIAEAKKLHENGLSYKRMEALGLEYRYLARHLQGQLSKKEMTEQLEREIWHYAKRQMTWFGKDKRIRWFGAEETEKIENEIQKFLGN